MTFHQAAFKGGDWPHKLRISRGFTPSKDSVKGEVLATFIVEVLFIHGNRGSFLSGVSPDDPKIIPGRL